MKLKIIHTQHALRREAQAWRKKDLSIAVVPTMGALHEGHMALIEAALDNADRIIVTLFVNPRQFAPGEDLGRYPRDEAGDMAQLAQAGANLAYVPAMEEIYAPNFATTISVAGPAKAGLEDKFRPHFFDGVATIVCKLFIQTAADSAVFGEKDYQQLLVVRQMARDLDIPIKVIGSPTVREADGLAMSSRNRYLSKTERQQAPAVYRSLEQAADKIRLGHDPQSATRAAARSLATLGFKVDYVTARNAETLSVPAKLGEPLRLLAAVWLGKTRLIDNLAV